MDLTDENKLNGGGGGGHPTGINVPLTRKTSKSLPVKATYNFSFRQHESCFTDISNSKSPSKNDSPMFYIGGHSPPTQPSLISDADHGHPANLSGKEIDRIDNSIRRTCSADALSTFKKHYFSRESRNGKAICRCTEDIRQHRRSLSFCSAGDENWPLTKDRMRQKKSNRPPTKYFNFYCNHVSSPSCRNSVNARPCCITPNFSIHNGRHSVIGAPFLNSPPFIVSALTGGGIGGDDSPTTGFGRQRSSIDSTAELDCIPSLPYDANFNLIDGRKCPVEFERLSVDEKSCCSFNVWPCSPCAVSFSCNGSSSRKTSLNGGGGGCSPNPNLATSFAREPPDGVERVQVIHEDRALSDFANTPIFFAPVKKVGLILKPSSNSAFCPLLPSRGLNNRSPVVSPVSLQHCNNSPSLVAAAVPHDE